MKIAVVGSGLMGPTIAMDCLESDEVEEVLLMDVDETSLKEIAVDLGNPSKLKLLTQDILDRDGVVKTLRDYDVACIALPKSL
ncbi:hypothetical protein KAH85_05690, partial [Candidatus Bathyarchaeota archaeon]|nr:hypothetical protein [Candidatus Bathyarchaeota archaeon]